MAKKIEGIVIDNKHATNGTLLVQLERTRYNKFYQKNVNTKLNLWVHSPSRENVPCGSRVIIDSCRPISKVKKHVVVSYGHNMINISNYEQHIKNIHASQEEKLLSQKEKHDRKVTSESLNALNEEINDALKHEYISDNPISEEGGK